MNKRDQRPSSSQPAGNDRRLKVRREVLRNLDRDLLEGVNGGVAPSCVWTKIPPE